MVAIDWKQNLQSPDVEFIKHVKGNMGNSNGGTLEIICVVIHDTLLELNTGLRSNSHMVYLVL